MKQLNLQQIRDQIDELKKLLSKFALTEDLKKLEASVHATTSKADKNQGDIKTLFDIINQLQSAMGKPVTKQGPVEDTTGPLIARVSFLPYSF